MTVHQLGDARVLIAGGSRGIGLAIATAFARHSARLGLCGGCGSSSQRSVGLALDLRFNAAGDAAQRRWRQQRQQAQAAVELNHLQLGARL